jgi:Mrp family chromosome partitioning ATPase
MTALDQSIIRAFARRATGLGLPEPEPEVVATVSASSDATVCRPSDAVVCRSDDAAKSAVPPPHAKAEPASARPAQAVRIGISLDDLLADLVRSPGTVHADGPDIHEAKPKLSDAGGNSATGQEPEFPVSVPALGATAGLPSTLGATAGLPSTLGATAGLSSSAVPPLAEPGPTIPDGLSAVWPTDLGLPPTDLGLPAATPVWAAEETAPAGQDTATAAPVELVDAQAAALPPCEPGPAPAAPWRPMLQVDALAWPTITSRLQSGAAAPLDQLAAGLAEIVGSGRKLLGFASWQAGEGVTTLLLVAAKRLAGQGLRVALVDGRAAEAKLARSLGLLPHFGWQDVLGGQLPLEEAVIESIADRMAVLPWQKPGSPPAGVTLGAAQVTASLDLLARNFDVVLVDLGPFHGGPAAAATTAAALARHVQAVVLVQDVRRTTPDQLAALLAELAAAGARHAGTIQNFVAR